MYKYAAFLEQIASSYGGTNVVAQMGSHLDYYGEIRSAISNRDGKTLLEVLRKASKAPNFKKEILVYVKQALHDKYFSIPYTEKDVLRYGGWVVEVGTANNVKILDNTQVPLTEEQFFQYMKDALRPVNLVVERIHNEAKLLDTIARASTWQRITIADTLTNASIPWLVKELKPSGMLRKLSRVRLLDNPRLDKDVFFKALDKELGIYDQNSLFEHSFLSIEMPSTQRKSSAQAIFNALTSPYFELDKRGVEVSGTWNAQRIQLDWFGDLFRGTVNLDLNPDRDRIILEIQGYSLSIGKDVNSRLKLSWPRILKGSSYSDAVVDLSEFKYSMLKVLQGKA